LRHDTCVVATTGGFTSEGLALEAATLQLSSLTQAQALEIGAIAQAIGLDRNLPLVIEVRMKDWIVFHASLPGSTPENDSWIARKARVVNATGIRRCMSEYLQKNKALIGILKKVYLKRHMQFMVVAFP